MHQNKHQNKNTLHEPVLLSEVLKYLEPKEGESYLDLTAGYGGHAKEVLARTRSPEKAVLVDRDKNAVEALKEEFKSQAVQIIHQDFLGAVRELLQTGQQFDLILADLGVSSPHLDRASRGFAFATSGPLDMRMDQSQALTAGIIVNNYDEADLADLMKRYGEEPKARVIAERIVANRPLKSTDQLAAIIAQAIGWGRPGKKKTHPATRAFQALRIAVNDELGQVEKSLPLMARLLAPKGRLAVISFHSLEDRLVKQYFLEAGGNRYDASLGLLTKKPVVPSAVEIAFNPRARSAKLRAVVKNKNI